MAKTIENAKIAILTCPFEPPSRKPSTRSTSTPRRSTRSSGRRRRSTSRTWCVSAKTRARPGDLPVGLRRRGEPHADAREAARDPVGGGGAGAPGDRHRRADRALLPGAQAREARRGGRRARSRLGTTKDRRIIIEDCAASKAVTIFVRGGNKMMIDETKRSLHDAICVARNLVRSNAIVYGGGAGRSPAGSSSGSRGFRPGRRWTRCASRGAGRGAHSHGELRFASDRNGGDDQVRAAPTKNPHLGIDCKETGTNDMKTQAPETSSETARSCSPRRW